MKVCTVLFGLLAACAVSYAVDVNGNPLLVALQPVNPEGLQTEQALVVAPTRQKRHLLLGAGALGAAALGAGVLGAGALGVGLLGAKAGLVGGVLAAKAFSGRSYGGYGYGGGYGHGGGYGYGGGYGGYYEAPPVYYGGGYRYRSYPTYVVEDEWC